MLPGLEQLIVQCAPNVAPSTLLAVVRVESGGRPYALNVNGGKRLPRQPESKAEASSWASWLIDKGYSVDLGLAQVNSQHLKRFGLSVEQIFDPCTNLAAGAKILRDNYANAAQRYSLPQEALGAALSAYNTGNHQGGFANGYVAKVTAAASLSHPLALAEPKQARQPGSPLVYWVRRP